ncbi:MAG: tetratricopeptide repeat protein [Desulfobacterales bacterium]|nr:tetratricopeptide repeat protein [Deltaproteobacteria bacterium]NNL43308.1 tetratricopeptide repeat protein [Desulfobacterales bacterium]
MKKNRLAWTTCLLIAIFFIASCGGAQLKKDQSKASRNLGEAYLKDQNYTSALRELLEAEKLYSDDHILHNYLGLAYRHKGKPDLAIEHYKKSLKLKHDYAPARNNLGTAYFDKKDWDSAIACYKEVAENLLYATPHYPLYNLGRAFYEKKEYSLSEKYYLAALEQEPEYAVALQGLGRTYIAMGRITEAVTALESAVKKIPEFAIAYLARSIDYHANTKRPMVPITKQLNLPREHLWLLRLKKSLEN